MYWNNKNIRREKCIGTIRTLEARKMYWNNKNIRGEKNVLEQ